MNLTFEKLLHEIIINESGEEIQPVTKNKLSLFLSNNDFEKDEDVPEWLMVFFFALKNKLSIEPNPLSKAQTKADVWEFFCDLQDLAELGCFDYGEWIRVRLPKHNMLGFISIEHSFYQTEKLSNISDDGLSDISEAKILNQ